MAKTAPPKTVRRYIKYETDDGEALWLAVGWDGGSGRIPPPYVHFHDLGSGELLIFRYSGRGEAH